ncbi:MAG: hypothetical protein K1X94_34635, partial [Sandaracinaceae bacterium]|nr:hypothetical protein [Sandaracinaceae bacterium]
RVVDVPLVRASWLCRPAKMPVLLGEGTGGSLDFLASRFEVADDLSSVLITDADVLLATSTPTHLHVDRVVVRHLVPFSAPSSVPPWLRAVVIVSSMLVSAWVAALSALRREGRHRAIAWALALAGPATALTVLRAFERAEVGDARLLLVPLAALAAALLARGMWVGVGRLARPS